MRDGRRSGDRRGLGQANDPRVTPVGRFLRRDAPRRAAAAVERAAGDMSLVGPRPERPEFVEELTARDSVLRPAPRGPAWPDGWAQVRYTYGASLEDALEKLQYDLFYIKNMSIALDLFIIFETIKTVMLRRGT